MSPIPSKVTLRKYGLTLEEWVHMWDTQGGVCPICLRPMTRPVVDHIHVKGWKKMPPDERKKYVRALLCWICNTRILTRGITPEKLDRAAAYLRRYEKDPQ